MSLPPPPDPAASPTGPEAGPVRSASVLIPTHNRSELLGRTLASLAGVRRPAGWDLEVVVVANNCGDDTVAVAERGLARLREAWGDLAAAGDDLQNPPPAGGDAGSGGGVRAWVVEEPEPGLNPARNRAVRESRGEVCLFLDDDVRLDAGWLEGMREGFDRLGADIVGGRVTLWWDVVQRPDWLPDSADSLLSANDGGSEAAELSSSTGLIGANFGFRRRVYDAVGGFRAGLDRVGDSLMGGGETEFVGRALREGFAGYYVPGAWVEHWVAPERLERRYLVGVAYGGGLARVLMKPAFPLPVAARTVAGHAWLAGSAGLKMALARLAGRKRAELSAACLSAVGRGGLAGVRRRWSGA